MKVKTLKELMISTAFGVAVSALLFAFAVRGFVNEMNALAKDEARGINVAEAAE